MDNLSESNPVIQFIKSQGWGYKQGTYPNIILDKCPYCSKEAHCYLEVHPVNSDKSSRSGLHICQKCGVSGNFHSLKQHLGIQSEPQGSVSTKDWSSGDRKVDPLPNVDSCHEALLANDNALDYLCNIRGLSLDIIKKQKIGVTEGVYFKGVGTVDSLVYPYLVNNQQVWCHYRTLPNAADLKSIPKSFASPTGWESTLYNGEVLKEGLKEVIITEGEMNVISALDHGIENICGVPGANSKKAEWISKLDAVEKIYICYDVEESKVGEKAAQAIASRIGIEKCYRITLPSFKTYMSGEEREGKDLCEWFKDGGGTKESFDKLKEDAQLFDVDGVKSSKDAMSEFIDDLNGKGAGYKYSWPLLNNLVAFDDGDLITVLAPEKCGKTSMCLNLLEFLVDTYGEDGIFINLEMTRSKMVRKWVSHKAGYPDNIPKTPEDEKNLTEGFINAAHVVSKSVANREGTLYFCYPKYKTVDDIYKLIIDCIRRYGVKFIVLDNLHRLSDTTLGNKGRTQHLSEISKMLSQVTKDYGVLFILILQPHRVGEGRIVGTDNVDGASQVSKDCDVMLVLNRIKKDEISKDMLEKGSLIETEGTFKPEMIITAGLSRYSAGGTTTVYFDGSTSTVKPLTSGKISSMLSGVSLASSMAGAMDTVEM